MSQFNPKRVMRKIESGLLKQLFEKYGVADLEPSGGHQTDFVHGAFDAWKGLADDTRKILDRLLHDVDDMASDEIGMQVILAESKDRGGDLKTQFSSMPNRYDCCVWTVLHRRSLWDAACEFARADDLSSSRSWRKRTGVPKQTPLVDGASLTKFGTLVGRFFQEEGRGQHCVVEHMSRGNGWEYFFAYVSDYADTVVRFDGGGKLLRSTDSRAFEVVFAYNQTEGALDTFVRGGKTAAEPLCELFSETILGQKLPPANSAKPPYQLDQITDRGFTFSTDAIDNISGVTVQLLKLSIRGRGRARVTLEPQKEAGHNIHKMLEDDLNSKKLPRELLRVQRAVLKIGLAGRGRTKAMTVSIGLPNHSNLKSHKEDLRLLGEKYLRKWKINA